MLFNISYVFCMYIFYVPFNVKHLVHEVSFVVKHLLFFLLDFLKGAILVITIIIIMFITIKYTRYV